MEYPRRQLPATVRVRPGPPTPRQRRDTVGHAGDGRMRLRAAVRPAHERRAQLPDRRTVHDVKLNPAPKAIKAV